MQRINSLGLVPISSDPYADDPYADQPSFGDQSTATTTTTTTQKKPITEILKDWFGVAKEGVDVYNQFKNSAETSVPGTFTPPPPPESNNTAKYLKYGLFAAGAGALAYGVYQISKPSKRKR